MLNKLPSPVIFAHRGASAHAPENTLLAFEMAQKEGADAIELDVKLSADEIPVIMHDPTVDRTTNGTGNVSDLSLSALKKLNAGEGQKIPTLAEVFERVAEHLFINIELTNYTTPNDALVDKVIEVIRQHKMEEKIIFSSFLPKNLYRAAELLPQAPRGLLALTNFNGWLARNTLFHFKDFAALHPNLQNCSRGQIALAHLRKRRVHTWTVNKAEDMRRLANWGVDGIFTDDPALAMETLRM